MLSLAILGTSKTQLIARANLSHKNATKYIAFLAKKGFLTIESDFERTRYILTNKGEQFLSLLRNVEKELSDFYVISLASEMKARGLSTQIRPSLGNERGRVPIEVQRALAS